MDLSSALLNRVQASSPGRKTPDHPVSVDFQKLVRDISAQPSPTFEPAPAIAGTALPEASGKFLPDADLGTPEAADVSENAIALDDLTAQLVDTLPAFTTSQTQPPVGIEAAPTNSVVSEAETKIDASIDRLPQSLDRGLPVDLRTGRVSQGNSPDNQNDARPAFLREIMATSPERAVEFGTVPIPGTQERDRRFATDVLIANGGIPLIPTAALSIAIKRGETTMSHHIASEEMLAEVIGDASVTQVFSSPDNARRAESAIGVPFSPTPTGQLRDTASELRSLVDSLALAKEMMAPRTGNLTIQHDEFGPVSLRFEAKQQELSVSITGEDPALQRAIAAVTPSESRLAQSEHRDPSGNNSSPQGHMRQSQDNSGQRRDGPQTSIDRSGKPGPTQSSENRNDKRTDSSALYA